MVDIVKEPTKQKYYKYECKEDALAAKKKRDNRAKKRKAPSRCGAFDGSPGRENVIKHEEKRWQIQLEEFCST